MPCSGGAPYSNARNHVVSLSTSPPGAVIQSLAAQTSSPMRRKRFEEMFVVSDTEAASDEGPSLARLRSTTVAPGGGDAGVSGGGTGGGSGGENDAGSAFSRSTLIRRSDTTPSRRGKHFVCHSVGVENYSEKRM